MKVCDFKRINDRGRLKRIIDLSVWRLIGATVKVAKHSVITVTQWSLGNVLNNAASHLRGMCSACIWLDGSTLCQMIMLFCTPAPVLYLQMLYASVTLLIGFIEKQWRSNYRAVVGNLPGFPRILIPPDRSVRVKSNDFPWDRVVLQPRGQVTCPGACGFSVLKYRSHDSHNSSFPVNDSSLHVLETFSSSSKTRWSTDTLLLLNESNALTSSRSAQKRSITLSLL